MNLEEENSLLQEHLNKELIKNKELEKLVQNV